MEDKPHVSGEIVDPSAPPQPSGERCPECNGSGERDGERCPACEGSGNVMHGLGGG
jgi:DnaJ-class molecular chaperone